MKPANYNATSVNYQNTVAINSKLLEPGASMFLDYKDSVTILKD